VQFLWTLTHVARTPEDPGPLFRLHEALNTHQLRAWLVGPGKWIQTPEWLSNHHDLPSGHQNVWLTDFVWSTNMQCCSWP